MAEPAFPATPTSQAREASCDMRWRIPGDESFLEEGAKRDPPRVRLSNCPATFDRVGQNCRPKCAAEMMSPFAPIDAGATQWAFLELERVEVDPTLGQEMPPLPRQMNQRAPPAQHATGHPSREEINSQAPRQVVIARAGRTHSVIFGTWTRAHMPDPCRDRNQGLDRICHVRVRDTKIAVTALLGAGDETRRVELLEVPGGCGRRHASLARQLGRREGEP